MIGTRPEAIKLAPVAAALRARGIEPLLVFTGQHPSLQPADHRLANHRLVQLDCAGLADPHAHVGAATNALAPVFAEHRPALVIVQGDTSSALAGALAAKLAGAAVAHVEAGLRSHDFRRPWPEEEFRVAIDRDCDLMFAPTELSAANLRRERVSGQVHVTGNSGIDAALATRGRLERVNMARRARLLVTCHRRESWGAALSGIAAGFRAIAAAGTARVEVILHPNEAVARQMREQLLGQDGIALRQPCTHEEMIAAMLASSLVCSDSGGMQEEAAALGVPMLVLRGKTERPEGIASGSFELVGTDPERIVAAVGRILGRGGGGAPALPFGDGKASERIAAIVADWLAQNHGAWRRSKAAGVFSERSRRANA